MARGSDRFLSYRGYSGSMDVSPEDDVIHGRILYIRDAISYESADVAGLKVAFQEAVENYLSFCAQVGDSPEKPFSGSFNVRIPEVLHRDAVIAADRAGTSLNKLVEDAIRQKVYPANALAWLSAIVASNTENVAEYTFEASTEVPRMKVVPKLLVVK